MSIPLTITQQLQERTESLKQALLANHPTMPGLLREIHQTLKQYPEQVTLLPEEEIQIIVQGLMKQTGVEFAAQASKPAAVKSFKAKLAAGTLEL